MVAAKTTASTPLVPHLRKAYKTDNLFIRTNNVLHKVNYKDILWVHADGNYCYLHTSTRKYAVKVSLKKLMHKLWKYDFIRIHKSFVIQLTKIARIDLQNNMLELENQKFPIGRAYKADLLDHLDIL
ncbi:MAG: LytTR family DNA-binding domain-containing protein [Bacteroidota bacterium]